MGQNKMRIIVLKLILSLSSITEFGNCFDIGEVLKYDAYFSNINAAEGSLKIIGIEKIDNADTYHVQFIAKTKGITNRIFPINDVIDLWLDKGDLLPHRVKSSIREGKFRKNEDIYFYQKDRYAIKNKKKINLEGDVHSPFSLFYYFRDQKLDIYKSQKINILKGSKIEKIKVIVENNIKVSVPTGVYNCTKIIPTKLEGQKFKNNAEMEIYFSDDSNHYPVKIKIKLKFGSLTLKLREIIN